jgi:hypothetical protein
MSKPRKPQKAIDVVLGFSGIAFDLGYNAN